MNLPRVVITGLGCVSPNGTGREAFFSSCLEGVSGLSRPEYLSQWNERWKLKTSSLGAVRDFDARQHLDDMDIRRTPRMVHFAVAASREALGQAGVEIPADDLSYQRKMGVALGTGGGGLAFVEEQYESFFTHGKSSLFSVTAGTHGNLSSELSIALKLRGPSHVLSTGCTSSTDAIGYATSLIRQGIVPMMLAGGADAPIAPGILNAFEKMRVVSTKFWDDPRDSSRPFQPDRDGFVLGEGSWMFVLEDLEQALARGAKPLAEVAGYASTCDAYHRVQIAPDLEEPTRAIQLSLKSAGLGTQDIGYVNMHGTSTDLNDRLESAAIRRAFGAQADKLACSSTKSMIGHPQGACGAAGIAATVLGLQKQVFHPTINQKQPDPACDLDVIANKARAISTQAALCNCIAFGSKNSCLVLKTV